MISQVVANGRVIDRSNFGIFAEFEKIWREMDQIEPLTPVTQYKRKT
jgi:hypothetical protein